MHCCDSYGDWTCPALSHDPATRRLQIRNPNSQSMEQSHGPRLRLFLRFYRLTANDWKLLSSEVLLSSPGHNMWLNVRSWTSTTAKLSCLRCPVLIVNKSLSSHVGVQLREREMLCMMRLASLAPGTVAEERAKWVAAAARALRLQPAPAVSSHVTSCNNVAA